MSQLPNLDDDTAAFWWQQIKVLPRIERQTLMRQLYQRYGPQVVLIALAGQQEVRGV